MHLIRRGSFNHFRGTEQKSPKCCEQHCLFKLRSTTAAGECKTREWSRPSRNFYGQWRRHQPSGELELLIEREGRRDWRRTMTKFVGEKR